MSTNAQESCATTGKFCWNELLTKDPAASGAFYSKLFGWKAEKFDGPVDYTIFKTDDQPMGAGGMLKMPDAQPGWLPYVTVENCDASAKKAKQLGGKIAVEPKDIPTVGRIAVLVDPQGAAIGLIQPLGK